MRIVSRKAKNNKKLVSGTKISRENNIEESIILFPKLDIYRAQELLKLLMSYKNRKHVIDASKVEYITTPCAQILLSYAKNRKKSKKSFRIKDYSENFKSAFLDLGFGNEFMEWSRCA